ncbi:hypothetical protein, partial [Helicobacter sp. UBA3407]
ISAVWNEFQTNENYTLEERASHYHDSILWVYECLCEIKAKVKIYKIETYSIHLTQEQLENMNLTKKQKLKESQEKLQPLRAEQIALWSAYCAAQSAQVAKGKMQAYQQKQKEIESQCGIFLTRINPNIEITHLSVSVCLKTATLNYNDLTQTTTTIPKTPIKELEITQTIQDLSQMSIKEAVEYYDRALKARSVSLDGKNVLVLDFEEECLGIVELSAKDFAPLEYDLPKHKDLESFEWEKLDEQYEGEEESEEN